MLVESKRSFPFPENDMTNKTRNTIVSVSIKKDIEPLRTLNLKKGPLSNPWNIYIEQPQIRHNTNST